MGKPYLFECEVGSPVVAWSTGDEHVGNVVSAATGVRDQVIILEPHSLKCGMLISVTWSPPEGFRVSGSYEHSDLRTNQWDATESTMVAVTLKQKRQILRWRHPDLDP